MNYNKGKKLLSERFYLTWAEEQMSWTVRMTLKMRDPVDGDLLRKAVESTSQRYPYYQVKLGYSRRRYDATLSRERISPPKGVHYGAYSYT